MPLDLEVLRYAALGAHHVTMFLRDLFDLAAANPVAVVLDVIPYLQSLDSNLLVLYTVEKITWGRHPVSRERWWEQGGPPELASVPQSGQQRHRKPLGSGPSPAT